MSGIRTASSPPSLNEPRTGCAICERLFGEICRHRPAADSGGVCEEAPRDKRGGDITVIALDDAPDVGQAKRADLVAVDDALTALAAVDRRLSQVIELRFSAVSPSTKRRTS